MLQSWSQLLSEAKRGSPVEPQVGLVGCGNQSFGTLGHPHPSALKLHNHHSNPSRVGCAMVLNPCREEWGGS